MNYDSEETALDQFEEPLAGSVIGWRCVDYNEKSSLDDISFIFAGGRPEPGMDFHEYFSHGDQGCIFIWLRPHKGLN